ncbi:MAG: PDZ domain-containing protein [Candidatus Omnitrophica bacterium]|nr:PDZ domain-containing protein [Candidatus Omnitrophota bacterium]
MKSKFVLVLTVLVVAFSAVSQLRAAEDDAGLLDDTKELFKQIQLFADSITLISTDYVEPVKAKDLVYGAIRGMMDTLDGYSQFLDPESFQEITEETKGEFAGIGIEVGVRENILTVIAPIEDTPAAKAGMEAGDKIVKIDGKITRDMTLDEAVELLRGKPGTEVVITVIRERTEEVLDFKIKRDIIKLKSISQSRIIEEDIAYMKIEEFQERTARDLRGNIKRLREEGARSLIIDVRNNPGGLLNASVESADEFLPSGALIVYTEGRDPEKRTEFKSKKRSDFDDLELVVIVNKGSASASEIFAGAIKDNKRGLVLGEMTFGKGSVQTVIPLKDKSALRLTTSAYFSPSGKSIREKGIEPDIYVKREYPDKKKQDKKPEQEKVERLFSKVKSEEGPDEEKAEEEDKTDEKKIDPLLLEDNQLHAAVNILKGMGIFESYKTSGRSDADQNEQSEE